jgi:hypothetical protein
MYTFLLYSKRIILYNLYYKEHRIWPKKQKCLSNHFKRILSNIITSKLLWEVMWKSEHERPCQYPAYFTSKISIQLTLACYCVNIINLVNASIYYYVKLVSYSINNWFVWNNLHQHSPFSKRKKTSSCLEVRPIIKKKRQASF